VLLINDEIKLSKQKMKFQKYYNVLKINDATKHDQNCLEKFYTINEKNG